jgi:murein DD-endopeptidase MepM/ murein hydrolase activator NlpD
MKEPIKKFKITSPYGWRVLNGNKQFHDGIDFISKSNNRDVFSIGPGVAVLDYDEYDDSKRWTDQRNSAGNYVIIKTKLDDGVEYYVRYLHLRENKISKGQNISEGEKIGEYDDVGYSFGAHLHLDIYNMAWKKIDPTPLLKSILEA